MLVYLKEHKKGILFYLLFSFVFIVVFWLYRLPLESVGYAFVICLFLGSIFFVRDFSRFQKKRQRLQELVEEITVTAERLPVPQGTMEELYQQILLALYADKQRITNTMNSQYADLVDYYTAWVHQIKTPIASMGLQLQEMNTEESRELLEELQKIEQYVEMVLTYLRLDANSTDYVIRSCDLDAILCQAARKFASQFIRKKIRLEYSPLHCTVLTDEKWLLFVIEQILSNALKYTRAGSISIELKDPKILCIRDTGIGIAPEDLPRIFQKGFTGYNGRNDKKASGIGLYLCKRICGNLGHRLWAESAPGEGTVVCLGLDSVKLEVE